jgi:AcrR family transcriptional regulator
MGATSSSEIEVTTGATSRARGRRGRPLSRDLDDRILQAAVQTLAEIGYARLRLDALAARAGVAKTTMLRRWPSKAAIAAAALQRLALQTTDVPEGGSLRDDLRALLANAIAAFADGPGRFVPGLMRESGHHPEIADLLLTVIETRRSAYRRVLNRAIARHELDPEVDQEFIIDLLIGPLWTRLLITRQPVTHTLVDEVVDVVLRAYPPPARTSASLRG